MPKVLIREYDKSTTGLLTASNFAVVVPGYFGEPKAGYDPEELLIDQDVYEIKSQAAFNNYIGKCVGERISGEAPKPEVINSLGTTDYAKEIAEITPDDFDGYYYGNEPVYIYSIEELENTDPYYGKNGKLLKTYSHTYTNTEGNEVTDVFKTVRFVKVEKGSDVEWEAEVDANGDPVTDENGKDIILSKNKYCKIKPGNEGAAAIVEAHIGNQMAYELLGLGYTVLYKKLDSEKTLSEQLGKASFWEPLKDKSIFNFRYITTGGYYNAAAMNQICSLAAFNNNVTLEEAETYGNSAGRGDCIALCDIDEATNNIHAGLSMRDIITKIGNAANAINGNQYSAIFGPKVTYRMADDAAYGNNKTFPASFHYLACAARTFERYSEWYAVSGYNRGISSYTIETTSVKIGEIAINTLAPRVANDYTTKSINLVLHERGNYYLWGNRTAYALDKNGIVFHHFLNIRQLCCSIKKQLYTACRQFTFDPNSDLL